MQYNVQYLNIYKNNNFYIIFNNKTIYLRKSKTFEQAKDEAFYILDNLCKDTIFILEEA